MLRSAAVAFSEGGYEGTSVDDLVKALNLHRGSLYKAFGSKRGLFLAAVTHYVDAHLASVTSDVLEHGAPEDLVDVLTRGNDLDLLLIAALERGDRDVEVAAVVRRALALLERAVTAATPPRAPTSTAVPSRAVDLLGARLFERLHPEPDIPTGHTTKET